MSGAAAQQQPRAGMHRIPFPLQSYEHPSPPLSAQRLINLQAEQEPDNARTAAALIPTHGLAYLGDSDPLQNGPETFGAGPIYAMNNDMPDMMYLVSGTHFWRTHRDGFGGPQIIEDLGVIGPPAISTYPQNIMYTIASGVNGAVVVSPPNAYTCTHDGPLNQIGGTFPAAGAMSVSYIDGYFVFTASDQTSQFFSSLLMDPTNFDALDFAYADGVPNVLNGVWTLSGDLWLVGFNAIEVWYNAGSSGLETTPGTSFFPFRRRPGGVIPHGAETIKSVVVCDGSLFWLGIGGVVFRSVGYRQQRISTHALEAKLRELGLGNVLSAVSYTWEGHPFYCLNYTTITFVYDCVTQLWHERSSSTDGSAPWRINAAAIIGERPFFGDRLSGRMLHPWPDGLEDGVAVIRQFTCPPLWADTYRGFCSRVEIEMEVGGDTPPGDVQIEWSNDGGRIWSATRTMHAGTTSDFRGRVYTTRLGDFRQRIFRVTAHQRATFYAVAADIVAGVA